MAWRKLSHVHLPLHRLAIPPSRSWTAGLASFVSPQRPWKQYAVDQMSIPYPFLFLPQCCCSCFLLCKTLVSHRPFLIRRFFGLSENLKVLLFLHRNYFVQALVEDPDDPMRSQYAPSFLATVRASKNILQVVKEQLSIQRVMVCRFWTIWTYTFSATVCS